MAAKDSTYLSAENLRELLSYCPETGVFTWLKQAARRVQIGGIAGSKTKRGYITISIWNKKYKAHRLAWLYTYGTWPKDQIDHINEIKDDNRICNLRDANNSQNQQNQRAAYKCNESGLLGATWHKDRKKFQACIRVNGKLRYLGLFQTAELAHAAYMEAKVKLHNFSEHINPH